MSTIHRPATVDLWWYAALAVVAGVLLAMILVVVRLGQETTTAPVSPPVPALRVGADTQADRTGPACFAAPHAPSIDLQQAGCLGARP